MWNFVRYIAHDYTTHNSVEVIEICIKSNWRVKFLKLAILSPKLSEIMCEIILENVTFIINYR